MTWSETLSEATGTSRDTTISSSQGTCNGEAQRWQDVPSMAIAPDIGGAQRWQDGPSVAKALDVRGAEAVRAGQATSLTRVDDHILMGHSKECWDTAVGPPVPRRHRNTHLENSFFQVLLPRQLLQEVVIELHLHLCAFDEEHPDVLQDEGNSLPLPQAV